MPSRSVFGLDRGLAVLAGAALLLASATPCAAARQSSCDRYADAADESYGNDQDPPWKVRGSEMQERAACGAREGASYDEDRDGWPEPRRSHRFAEREMSLSRRMERTLEPRTKEDWLDQSDRMLSIKNRLSETRERRAAQRDDEERPTRERAEYLWKSQPRSIWESAGRNARYERGERDGACPVCGASRRPDGASRRHERVSRAPRDRDRDRDREDYGFRSRSEY